MHGEVCFPTVAAGCSGIPAVAGPDTFRRDAGARRMAARERTAYQPFVLV
jgi:hypothetical protein